jgi:NTE family protein
VTSNVTRQRVEVLSAATQPELPVWKAVRMSIGIPLIFAPVHHEGCAYVDGGVCWDYPVDLFDRPTARPRSRCDEQPRSSETLGFALGTRREIDDDRHGWRLPPARTHSLLSYLKALATLVTGAANRGTLHAADIPRTIFIDDLGVSPADFDAAPQVIEKLIESGRAAAQAYFANAALNLKTTDEHRVPPPPPR